MKRTAALLLVLLMLLGGTALAEITFTYNAYMGFVDEEMKIRINHDGKDAGKTLEIRAEDGTVLGERKLSASKGYWNIDIDMPQSIAPGTQISLHWQGENAVLDSALLAVETRPGYSIVRVDREDKKIAITFDAANAASKTAEILDVLDKHGAKCTFFVIGRYVVNHPDLVREIEARGHEVAGHSWDHPDMPSLNNDQILTDFSKISEAFMEVLGHDVTLYRPPSGYSSQRDRAIARALGQEVIKWTVDSRDGFQDTTLNTVIKRVQNNVKSGDIVLMHVYGQHTIAALETLLPWYMEQGYEFVTVSELLLSGDTVIDTEGVQRLREENP